jgi:plasmid stabilization system protein ParE
MPDGMRRLVRLTYEEPSKKQIEDLLAAIGQGNERAMPELIELIYAQLKRLAHFQLAGSSTDPASTQARVAQKRNSISEATISYVEYLR